MSMTTSQLRNAWGPPCNSAGYVTISLHGEGRVTVDPRMREAVNRFNDVLKKWNYRTRRNDTGAYNCRQITGGSGYSLHSYGVALDINWTTNPYKKPPVVTDMPSGMVTDILALRTNNGKPVWEWGGRWGGNVDAMHYEVDCAPADLATGIAAGGGGRPIQPEPPRPSLTAHTGEPSMFVVIHEVGFFAMFGHVLFKFRDGHSYNAALNASRNVPILVIDTAESRESRNWLQDRLLEQGSQTTGHQDWQVPHPA